MDRLNSNESSFSEGNFVLWNLIPFHWIQWIFIESLYMQGAKWNKKINKMCSDWLLKKPLMVQKVMSNKITKKSFEQLQHHWNRWVVSQEDTLKRMVQIVVQYAWNVNRMNMAHRIRWVKLSWVTRSIHHISELEPVW